MEEEFHYTEEEEEDGMDSVSEMDSFTQSFAGMYTSSPPNAESEKIDQGRTFDHDYQRKVNIFHLETMKH